MKNEIDKAIDLINKIQAGNNLSATPLRAPGRGGRAVTTLVIGDVVNRFTDDEPSHTRQLVRDFIARDEYGYDKYGQNLEADDGRPTVWDLYQELLDGCQYARKQIEEKKLLPGMETVYPTLLEITLITRRAITNSMAEEDALDWGKPNEGKSLGDTELVRPDDAEEHSEGISE